MTDVLGKDPILFYSYEEAKKYNLSGAFKRIQKAMTLDALEIINFEDKSKILDLGCGTGFSTKILKEKGFNVIGLDISKNMLIFAKEKNLKVIESNMTSLPFKDNSFNGLISISAIQWLKNQEYNIVLKEINRVIKNKAIIQFYPKNNVEFDYFIKLAKKIFKIEIYEVGQGNKKKKFISLYKK